MALNLDVIGKKFGPVSRTCNWQDIVLYALGVGAGYDELEYVYENRLKVLPSFAILSIYDFFTDFITASDEHPQDRGGQLSAMQAYSSSRLKIEGDLLKSQLVEKVFKF